MSAPPALLEVSQPTARSTTLRADGLLVLVIALWAVSFLVVKDALGYGDSFSFLTLRFLTGAVVLSALAGRRMLRPENLRRGALLGFFLFVGYALQTVGLTTTTPSRSAFITGLGVVFVPMWALLLLRRVPHVTSVLGVALAVAGLYLLTRMDTVGALAIGEVLSLGCAVVYALHLLLTERYAGREGAMALVAVQLWTVALLSALCLPFVEPRVEWNPAFIGAFVFCGVVASALLITLQTWAQARTSAVRAALIFALEPVFTSVYSVALGYEVLGAREWGGGALILAGVLLSELGLVLWAWWRGRAQVAA